MNYHPRMQCIATTAKGTRCTLNAKIWTRFCGMHIYHQHPKSSGLARALGVR